MNLNKAFILGRLTVDPQLRTTPNGQQVASFGMATNRVWVDKSGQKQEATEFHNIVVWGRQAEVASQFLMKGSLALIEGRLQTRTWEDQQGQQRRTTEIVSERLQLGPKPLGKSAPAGNNSPGTAQSKQAPVSSDTPVVNVGDEEINEKDLKF